MRRLTLLALFVLAFGFLAPAARAGTDPFTVSGILVDASAASAIEAETIAINSGRQRAWTALYRHLTKSQDWPNQPVLDDTTLQRLIRNYLPMNERRSTTRYVASMTYVFNPDAVRRIFRQANIAYADTQAKPILIVPMAPGYRPRGGWTMAWANPHFTGAAVPLVLPPGDAADASALATLNFSTSTWQDIQPAVSRLHAVEAWLALALVSKGQFTVKLRRLGPGNAPAVADVVVPIPPRAAAAKISASAADAAANTIIDAWKAREAIDYGKRSRLLADVRIDSLDAWSAMLQRLGTVPTVTDVAVVAMNIGEARLAISYVGTSDQLAETLTQAGLELSNDDGSWQLAAQPAQPLNADTGGQ